MIKRLLGLGKKEETALTVTSGIPGEAEWLATRYASGARAGGMIKGREVAIWRPPVMLDRHGKTMGGVSKELIADYLVSTTGALAETELGAISVSWDAQEGRFATTTLTIHSWGTDISMLHPIAPISQDLMNALQTYRDGIILKVRELHRGHQSFAPANERIADALARIHELRDSRTPQFNDAEFMFIVSRISQGLTMSALIPADDEMGVKPETVFQDSEEDPTMSPYRYEPVGKF